MTEERTWIEPYTDVDAYLQLLRAHDFIWDSRRDFDTLTRLDSCKTIWGVMLELRDPIDIKLFDPDAIR